ncbi:GMC family oxidoreductase [Usitatibacter palustris]|uniref:Putative GMC-type oxidoreductase n=1 Tax=Usitatibacter palustris TaxID=2732487 RepID=A0A6M4H6C0_9PROT|nr:GMC family oxidoreductase [Usitatibacter palustris]QJR15179.1 putative GMC-type oxidoreductase [Usitatibacter palustris]
MIRDPIREGIASGWKAIDAAALDRDLELDADVVVIGSGAGGGVTAEVLADAGLKVVIAEEGPLRSSTDFNMREREAYPQLYQETAGRQTKDKGITILQGRCVGGSTTVNWTSSFRTPSRTLAHWRDAHGLTTLDEARLSPWFVKMEERLAIAPWPVAPNENNDLLRRGCEKLGIPSAAIARNVKGCWNLGYCGMGCPTNAKQSMLVTTIPGALAKGATLIHQARVERLVMNGERIDRAEAVGIASGTVSPYRIRLRARHFVLAAGGIGSATVLLRSRLPDPNLTAGRRTFLHPTVVSGALMPDEVKGHAGAPQTIYSDHFLDKVPLDGPAGFKLEAAPVHPILAGITLPGFGEAHAKWMTNLPRLHVAIALLRDGFHPSSPGGRVVLRGDGSGELDYAMGDYLWEGARRGFLAMAEIQFAAGAKVVMPMHEEAEPLTSWQAARAAIEALPMRALRTRVVSAHVMGGCAMGNDPRVSVVNEDGRHHQVENLSIHDGSLFPTSVAANPQLSIYALAARLSSGLAKQLGPRV